MAMDSDKFLEIDDLKGGHHLDQDSDVLLSPLGTEVVALFEGKMFHFCNHRHGDYGNFELRHGKKVKELPPPSEEQLADPVFEVSPRYWVEKSELTPRLQQAEWDRGRLIAWRDVTGPTLVPTCIACVCRSWQ